MPGKWVIVPIREYDCSSRLGRIKRYLDALPREGKFMLPEGLDSSRFENTWHDAPPFANSVIGFLTISLFSFLMCVFVWVLFGGSSLMFWGVSGVLILLNGIIYLYLPYLAENRTKSICFDRDNIMFQLGSGEVLTVPWDKLQRCRFDTYYRNLELWFDKTSRVVRTDENVLMAICARYHRVSGKFPEFCDSTPRDSNIC